MDWRYLRQFVKHVAHFSNDEIDALPWDCFLDEVVTSLRLHEDLNP